MAKFQVMDILKLDFMPQSFDAIICFRTLLYFNYEGCKTILDKFDILLKQKGFVTIQVPELIDNKKSFDMPFLNRYTKDFFLDYFIQKGYKNPQIFDDEVSGKNDNNEFSEEINKFFSIIIQKQ